MLAGRRVFVLVTPRVLRNLGFFPVRPVPVVEARRRADQRLEALLRRWIAADLELEEIERLANLTDFYFCGIGLGFFAAADEVAADDAEHDTDQDEHDEDLDQRHARRMFA